MYLGGWCQWRGPVVHDGLATDLYMLAAAVAATADAATAVAAIPAAAEVSTAIAASSIATAAFATAAVPADASAAARVAAGLLRLPAGICSGENCDDRGPVVRCEYDIFGCVQ